MTSGVSIVIPTWNGVALLKRFLPSVIEAAIHYSNQSQAPTEIIVVDDAGTDETVDWLLSEGFSEWPVAIDGSPSVISNLEGEALNNEPPATGHRPPATTLRFIRNEINRGFGETCNRGFEAANYPLVFLLNNDVEVNLDSIAPLVENFAGENVFAAHCRVFELESARECGTGKLGGFARGFIRVHRSYAASHGDEKAKAVKKDKADSAALYSMFAGGGSAMFDRKKFLEMGGFEPLLSPFYWEDVELSYRAWKRGYSVLYEPRAVARHRVSSTIGRLKPSKVRKIEQRNRLIFHWINLHDKKMFASHVAWLILLAVTSPLRLRPGFISSLAMAIKSLPQIRNRRREEKQAARRSDKEVFEIFASLEKRGDVFAYDDYVELRRLNEADSISTTQE